MNKTELVAAMAEKASLSSWFWFFRGYRESSKRGYQSFNKETYEYPCFEGS